MKCVWSGLKYLCLWMRQKAIASVLNWETLKKNKLFSYALWHDLVIFIGATNSQLINIYINKELFFKTYEYQTISWNILKAWPLSGLLRDVIFIFKDGQKSAVLRITMLLDLWNTLVVPHYSWKLLTLEINWQISMSPDMP